VIFIRRVSIRLATKRVLLAGALLELATLEQIVILIIYDKFQMYQTGCTMTGRGFGRLGCSLDAAEGKVRSRPETMRRTEAATQTTGGLCLSWAADGDTVSTSSTTATDMTCKSCIFLKKTSGNHDSIKHASSFPLYSGTEFSPLTWRAAYEVMNTISSHLLHGERINVEPSNT
jgi:hypothetical protein